MDVIDYKSIKLSAAQRSRLRPNLTSWRTVHSYIKDLEDSKSSLKVLSDLLALEISNPDGPRHQILSRLHMRINAMRQRIEVAAVMKHARR